ncbi:V-type proton ATPase 16 kDa proteolipid subunit-like [Stegodyphus dumicola]|uniref:V-type proton ATPase 16 kDa proteolipid subunit-like n=1 Tax=Stegodyphus dumicola TaxID=202533 RepID=UPI0015A8D596|nr:V-type proton ATPase 16 kDa proteolipid subunit-like [Stegodyphus dumicola]
MLEEEPIYAPFFGSMGASVAMILSSLGAVYGTLKSGTAISAAGTVRPDLVMKSLIPVVMSGIVAIYGLVEAILIANSIFSSAEGYTLYTGFLHFGAGLTVGLSGMGSGYAIGLVGEAGVRYSVQQPNLFVAIILMLIFAEVLGLYGLIIGLILTTKV